MFDRDFFVSRGIDEGEGVEAVRCVKFFVVTEVELGDFGYFVEFGAGNIFFGNNYLG